MKNKNKTVWSNRFGKTNSKNFQRIGASINVDKRLYNEDIQASIVHVQMLTKKKIIPICIDEEFALDIERVSKNTNLNIKEIYQHILNKDFYCYMTGFVAGMPFLGDTNKNIRLKRLETPRVKVPKGSVGITEQFCNIYSYESPGGWNIIGNTPVKVFDQNKEENPILIIPGDSVQFYEITKKEFYKIKGIK